MCFFLLGKKVILKQSIRNVYLALGFLRIIPVIMVRQRINCFSKNPSEQILGRMCRKWNGIKHFVALKDQNIHCDRNVHRKKMYAEQSK